MSSPQPTALPGLQITAPIRDAWRAILSNEALELVAALVRLARPRRNELLAARAEAQARWDAGDLPDFPAETAWVRAAAWTIAPLPADLCDRRVEITGPVERKMIINALNSGANVFMADFEDSNAPTWENIVEGQVNLRDAVNRTITFVAPDTGKTYQLDDRVATLFVRPRGWHLVEKHVLLDGEPVPGGILDFGLYLYHNVRALLRRGTGPYLYLPKMQHYLEARLWNDVFVETERLLSLPPGTIKATVLIETLPAAFQMDEILWELRDHSAGLNCGRWDYIFSWIKTLREHPDRVLPDRSEVTMTQPFMRAYTQQLIRICHRRGAPAMGGMAAQIPIKGDPARNEAALDKVRADKQREASDGHDGTWVAHPALVPIAKEIFDTVLDGPNQLHKLREDAVFEREDLLQTPTGKRTLGGLRHSVRVGVEYIEAWLRGIGCVPLYDLMEDAATAEIARAQIWQWIHHGVSLDDGTVVDATLVGKLLDEEIGDRRGTGRFDDAATLFGQLCTSPQLTEFLTLPAYDRLA